MFVEDEKTLQTVCARYGEEPVIGFDTEFVRERTYYPRLEILQIVSPHRIDLIDCQAIENLEPLWKVLCNPDTEKVVHSAAQDMELIYQESGRLPGPIFDTQIAASLLGLGAQCGYGRLVASLLGEKVAKGETFSDWSRRPLHPDQLRYAEEDVRFLLDLYRVLRERLKEKDRLEWVREECSHLSDPKTFERLPPSHCYLKIKGRNGLRTKSLSVLRALAEWREEEAMKRNLPPARIVKDHVLLSLAKTRPTSVDELKRQRGFGGGDLVRRGEEIIRIIEKGIREAGSRPLETVDSKHSGSTFESESIFKILSAVLQLQAEKAEISPSVLGSSQDLRRLAEGFRNGSLNGIPLLKGWRRELAGEMLLSVLRGEVALRVDPESTSLTLMKSHE